MPDRVSENDVRHVAHLARLGIEPSKIPRLVRELNGILEHMDVLARIDTSHVQPFVPEKLDSMPLRSDSGESVALALPLEKIAPEMRDGFFLVPRLATHEDEASHSS
jgi:aspartyl-tRNA(Asn)/glutamyl-tRNA(Gln) amidotransferase subunit C